MTTNFNPQDFAKMGTEWGNWQKYAGINSDNPFGGANDAAVPPSPAPNTEPYKPSAPMAPVNYSLSQPSSPYGSVAPVNAPPTLGLPSLKSPLLMAAEQHLGLGE